MIFLLRRLAVWSIILLIQFKNLMINILNMQKKKNDNACYCARRLKTKWKYFYSLAETLPSAKLLFWFWGRFNKLYLSTCDVIQVWSKQSLYSSSNNKDPLQCVRGLRSRSRFLGTKFFPGKFRKFPVPSIQDPSCLIPADSRLAV